MPEEKLLHHQQEEFMGDIESLTLTNQWFRDVQYTTPTMQLVLMNIAPSEDIPMERHCATSQLIRVEGSGRGIAIIGGRMSADGLVRGARLHRLQHDSLVVIPPNTWHNIVNTGPAPLQVYTVYSPPEHAPGTRHHLRRDDPEIGGSKPVRRHAAPYTEK